MSRIVKESIDAGAVISSVGAAEAGAVLSFAGTVRNNHRGRDVTGIEYHAYESMAIRQMDHIEDEVRERWPEARVLIVHRVGYLAVGETSVLIAVSSPHREEGFAALRYAIDTLKQKVPIWKKEMYVDGHAWIEGS